MEAKGRQYFTKAELGNCVKRCREVKQGKEWEMSAKSGSMKPLTTFAGCVSVERKKGRKLDCRGFRSEWDGGEIVTIHNCFKIFIIVEKEK